LNLSPRVVAVETDDQGHWRPTLLDLGWMLDSAHVPNGNGLATLLSRSEPAYTAPEARVDKAGGGVSPAADAYSFGMMHFEMLAGRPGVVQQWRRDELVVKDVIDSARREQTLPIDQDKFRPELSRAGVVTIIEKAISARERFASVLDIQKGLLGIYGEPPPEKRAVPIRLYILLGIIGLALIGVLVAAVVLFARGGG
jgi:hypothetical protein